MARKPLRNSEPDRVASERSASESFDRAFKAWAERAPATPADQAAGQVLERLARRPTRPRRSDIAWRWANAFAAILLAAVIVARFSPMSPSMPSATEAPSGVQAGVVEAAPLPEGVVLMWLDAETPLYLTMNPPEIPQGEPSS